jgi:tetratricopeptide (TPR) repeat protein
MRPCNVKLGVSLGLIALTLITYGDMVWDRAYDLVSFDDYHYVRDNSHVGAGLSVDGLEWALKSFDEANWHPLTWVSLQLDAEIFGTDPRGFHLTNLLLHAANSALLFLLLLRATGAVWPAAAVAAFFAVHPLHVESVAWVTERKDVLSTFFWLLTLLAYTRYVERPGAGRYWLALICMILGLMSKPMVVTLPCAMLLFDYWPLGRWTGGGQPETSAHGPQVSMNHLLKEKIPFFLLAACCSFATLHAQTPVTNHEYSFGVRVLNTMVSYVTYLGQTFWPSDLSVLYLHSGVKLPLELAVASGLLLLGITLLALHWRRRRPYFAMGWFWYLGTLVPAIGLFRQVGLQAHADRYTYIPLIGIFIVLSWGAEEFFRRLRHGRWSLSAITGILLIACATVTGTQLRYWRNSTTLWNRALQVSGDDSRLHFIVAKLHLNYGETDLAILHAKIGLQQNPDDFDSYSLLAVILKECQKLDDATEVIAQAVAKWPDLVEARKEMAAALWRQDRIPAAYAQLAVVARLQPDSAEGQNYSGRMLQLKGDVNGAAGCFWEAVRLAPKRWDYRCDLAYVLDEKGDHFDAVLQYNAAFEIDPTWPAQSDRLARILATHSDPKRRDGAEAVRRSRQVCKVTQYQNATFLETLAAAYAETGLFQQAVETAARALNLIGVTGGEKGLSERLNLALQGYRNGQPLRID